MRRYLDLIFLRALAEIKSGTKQSHLGALWWFLDPLLYLSVFYVVFGVVLHRGGDGFVTYLIIGLVFWRWFESSIHQCSSVLINYKGVIDQVYLPKIILPFIPFFSNVIRFLIILSVLLILLILFNTPSYSTWHWLPVLLLGQALMILSIGVLLSALLPFFPDLRSFIGYGLSLLFFMSAIFYRIDDLSEKKQFFFMFNPMVFYIESQRGVLIEGTKPALMFLFAYIVMSLIVLCIGLLLLHRYDRRYPKIMG
ncbi:ABC transporter permease [Oceanicoccus sp. KOV_DT_Chl]|uniref:ABC transporter permease n=1 Tax=Oceanicoccus sp. KOV_DT_Chl TaxID=1904639 RepID=UPI000C798243|nr:ABC transporter permease [Oceanicoccus sp. KOV_DT_Chl]